MDEKDFYIQIYLDELLLLKEIYFGREFLWTKNYVCVCVYVYAFVNVYGCVFIYVSICVCL